MARAKRVGIVVLPSRTFCRRIVEGIVAAGSRAGWEHVLVPTDSRSTLKLFGKGFVDGYIGHFSDQTLVGQVRETGLPAVNISSALPGSALPGVITDEVAVGRLAATYLLSLGLPQFAYVGEADDYPALARGKGFEDMLKAAGFTCYTFFGRAHTDAGMRKTPPSDLQNWMRRLPTPIGLLSSSDIFGLHILAICAKFKIAVPKEAAVLGVGNDDLLCNISNPPMTSIALATQRIGFDGALMLANLMDGIKLKEETILIPPVAVVPRQSSALRSLQDQDVAAAVSYIALHTKDNLHVADVLRKIPVSRSSLDKRFVRLLGHTPAHEIRHAKVELAKTMLSQTQEQMPTVAVAAGFINAKQFTTTFHREVGMTPTVYRRQMLTRGQVS
jgi:LacI family transcriptional regulator